jgi:hypothetical protein
MTKFLVLYLAPVSVVDDWKKTDPEKRKAAETKMQNEWKDWTKRNAAMFADMGGGAGKTKRVDTKGVADSRNDIMLYAIVQAESHDAAAKAFADHPHLQIPQASIEIVQLHPMGM